MQMVILLLPGRSPVQSTDQILLLLLAILLLLYANFHKGVSLQELNIFPLISFAFFLLRQVNLSQILIVKSK